MSALAEVQRRLAAALDEDNGPAVDHLLPLLAAGPGRSAAARLSIYRTSARRARERALEQIYPVCREILGPRCFAALAEDYVREFASHGADLNNEGARFPAHLAACIGQRPQLAALPYLPDLACLERDWHAAYYAADDPPFDPARLAALQAAGRAEAAVFRLSAALRLLASRFPVRAIWHSHHHGGRTDRITLGQGDRLVIRRAGPRPTVDAVDPPVHALLSAIADGHCLGELATRGLALEQLPQLIAQGYVVAIDDSAATRRHSA
ncbi:MAG: DNA-binding domain-containing protein [Thiohalocapsa sp.]|nr:DNA-binding domain-containing protein [Thiohalocapsa sp.]